MGSGTGVESDVTQGIGRHILGRLILQVEYRPER